MPRIAVIVLVVLAGCATTSTSLRPLQVADHAGELLRDGRARVPMLDGSLVTVKADERVEVRLVDPDGIERPVKLTLGSLVQGCVDDVTSPACLAYRAVDDPVVTHHKLHVDPDKIVAMIAVAGLGGAMGWCTVACEDPDREFRRGAMVGGGIVVGFVGLFSLFLLGPD